MSPRPGPIESATQAPGEYRDIPTAWATEKKATLSAAKRLLDECNGDLARALMILEAVANA
jgi:hypothetical protein